MSVDLKPSGFKKSYLPQTTRDQWAREWSQAMLEPKASYLRGEIEAPELCARLLLSVYTSLFKEKWKNGGRQSADSFDRSPALREFSRYRLRGLPEDAAQALLRWGRGEIVLQLFFEVPSPYEVLRLQARGVRCLSLMLSEDEMRKFSHEGRDFLSFVVHDLIHAQQMTLDPLSYSHQVKFAGWILNEWSLLVVGLSVQARQELEYLASDMNSHIIHLMKTLKSWIQRHRPELLREEAWLRSVSEDSQLAEKFVKFWGSMDEPETHPDFVTLWESLVLPQKAIQVEGSQSVSHLQVEQERPSL